MITAPAFFQMQQECVDRWSEDAEQTLLSIYAKGDAEQI